MNYSIRSASKIVFILGATASCIVHSVNAQAAPKSRVHFRCRPDQAQELSFSAEGDAELAAAPEATGLVPALVNISSLSLTSARLSSTPISAVVESSSSESILHLKLSLAGTSNQKTDLEFQIALQGATNSELIVRHRSNSQKLHARCEAQPVCQWVAAQANQTEKKIELIESQMTNLPKYVAEKLRSRLDEVAGSSSPSELNRELAHQRQVLANFDLTIETEKQNLSSTLYSERSRIETFEEQTRDYGCPRS